jgi:hypothetical protein
MKHRDGEESQKMSDEEGATSTEEPILPEELLKDNVIMRSTIKATKVGEIKIIEPKKEHCPTCLNVVDDKNMRLVCEKCSTTTFCSQCEKTMARTWTHKGYDLKYDWPLCRKCYHKARDDQIASIDAGKTEGFTRSEETASMEMAPIIETKNPEEVGRYLGMAGILIGAVSVFVMGLLLGPLAVGLGFMARARMSKMGIWAMVLGGLGIATTLFWIMITGEIHWFF